VTPLGLAAAAGAPAALPDLEGRAGRSTWVAGVVRAQILDGTLLPGTRLSEPQICAAVDVSRNTLREAFRTLVQERLVVHELHRGVFVRVPSRQDVGDLYDCRRLVQCAALRGHRGGAGDLAPVAEVLRRADERAAAGDWVGVGTADIDFHRALTALAGSVRITALMQGIWNEMRLVFHVVGEPHAFHGAYLDRNHALHDVLATGDARAAEGMLHTYLDDAERRILDAYRRRDAEPR
jgi:DNA-binding GntR family transcriptional regulator